MPTLSSNGCFAVLSLESLDLPDVGYVVADFCKGGKGLG
jgi:hypothetical protein